MTAEKIVNNEREGGDIRDEGFTGRGMTAESWLDRFVHWLIYSYRTGGYIVFDVSPLTVRNESYHSEKSKNLCARWC